MEILESKNTVAKMKNSLERYNTTFEVVEERISEIEDIDTMLSEKQIKNNKEK